MQRHFMRPIGAILGLAFLAAPAWAQQPGTITATGTQSIRVQASAIRLAMSIQADGKTAKEAIEALHARRDSTIAKLKTLGAEAASIRSAAPWVALEEPVMPDAVMPMPPPTYVPGSPPASYPMPTPGYLPPGAVPPTLMPMPAEPSTAPASEAAPPLLAPAPAGPSTSTFAPVPTPATQSVTLPPPAQPATAYLPGPVPMLPPKPRFIAHLAITAKWPIDANKPDAVALAAESLRGKLVEAKLIGDETVESAAANNSSSVPQAFSPASVVANAGTYAPTTAPTARPPVDMVELLYVGQPSKEDCKRALAAAAAQARQRATELADAAGCHIGNLVSVEGNMHGDYPVPSVGQYGELLPYTLLSDEERSCELDSRSPNLSDTPVRVTLKFQIVP